jgi:hypothetical protein
MPPCSLELPPCSLLLPSLSRRSRCSRCSRCSDDETPSPARVADGLWLRWLRLRDDEWAGR